MPTCGAGPDGSVLSEGVRPDALIALVRTLELDHGPGGWPAVEMATLTALADEIERLRDRLDRVREPSA